jgi:hypothetical protein
MKIQHASIGTKLEMLDHFHEFEKDNLPFKKTWIYRGQKCDDRLEGLYKLRTSLEKALTNCDHSRKKALRVETGLFRKFKRQSGQFLTHAPDQGDYMEWFALMQHHGAPTRLLDWTYSFFVALYFAVAELEKSQDGELWALDVTYLKQRIERLFPKKSNRRCAETDDPNAQVYGNFECMFMRRKPEKFVCSMNPYKFNTRLTIQQGLFLCPGDTTVPFGENLETHFPSQKELDEHVRVFRIQSKARGELMQVLHRMNVGEASLFPGLDGFAKSLKDLLVFPEVEKMFPPDPAYVKKNVWQKRQ